MWAWLKINLLETGGAGSLITFTFTFTFT
jgi:hypothetical protein